MQKSVPDQELELKQRAEDRDSLQNFRKFLENKKYKEVFLDFSQQQGLKTIEEVLRYPKKNLTAEQKFFCIQGLALTYTEGNRML